ncbi:MAG: lipopolysaccharide transport periplasmic protein LptA [Gammaproteobacteria bacterium]|nr:lipopolysaccharide transport periplasmic protein LptA [Gammaproteobacteria bacterium]
MTANRLSSLYLLIITLLSPALCHALSTDKDQPIHLEADSVEIDEASGISVYLGNVIITQGSLKLWADKMWIHRNQGGIQKIITEGNPTHFRQLMDNSPQEIRGSAKRAELMLDKDELHLSQDALLEQAQDRFQSDRIIFLRSKSLVKAGTSAQGKERVRVVIEPAQTAQ